LVSKKYRPELRLFLSADSARMNMKQEDEKIGISTSYLQLDSPGGGIRKYGSGNRYSWKLLFSGLYLLPEDDGI
jgi:hypothetical protein